MAMILNDATIPNSFKSLLSVKMNVANPEAVVRLVIKVAFPIFVMTRCNDFTFITMKFNFILVFIDQKNTIWDTNDYN